MATSFLDPIRGQDGPERATFRQEILEAFPDSQSRIDDLISTANDNWNVSIDISKQPQRAWSQ